MRRGQKHPVLYCAQVIAPERRPRPPGNTSDTSVTHTATDARVEALLLRQEAGPGPIN